MHGVDGGPALSVGLRDGGSLELWSDRIVADGRTYPLSELRGAVLSSDRRAPSVPAVALRGRSGGWAVYVPADPPDAWRALDAILARRPDLADEARRHERSVALPPGEGRSEAILAGIAHLSVCFAPIVLPLIVWVATRRDSPYASRQAQQAFYFHLLLAGGALALVVVLLAAVLGAALAGVATHDPRFALIPLVAFPFCLVALLALVVSGVGLGIYAALQAFAARPFAYPIVRRL